ncbi:MAG: ribonucleoside-diphosphate reductase subunit alpha, partial [Pirellulaceae bacterium]|nr:ribonucleoside-diphosphate reductase subunit alpha [Pirellulaceae bacterium]
LETWHLDVEEFLDLRKNTGDERRRTHDMHTANWIPDLFMKRVEEKGEWTLFSPDEVPDLHDLCGAEFEERYTHYEKLADEGKLDQYSRISALDLWRKMLSRLFETGHPWITWKDPSNVRSTQSHVGVIHSSNLCTEILLNTSREETAVCNLGSVNLPEHIIDGQLNLEALEGTIQTAIRMLDNVIGINFYPIPEASEANHRHRPVGLGVMGFQDALLKMRIGYASQDAVNFADRSMEAISYYAILSSSQLAAERGTYSSYQGSKWDQGLLPIDTIDLLEKSRGQKVDLDRSSSLPWQKVRESIAEHGMRNSNVMAIAPTATISTIVGVSQSIEPSYKHLFVKSNLSGEFTQVNSRLVEELKERDLWGPDTLEALKHFDGSLLEIPGMPEDLKERYRTAFEIEPKWLIECAARRQKWIDMGQSLNLYMAEASGRKLNDMYFLAWKKGLKTTYYLRSLAATTVEKSTVDVNRFGIQPRWMKSQSSSSDIQVQRGASCNLDGTCEACE